MGLSFEGENFGSFSRNDTCKKLWGVQDQTMTPPKF